LSVSRSRAVTQQPLAVGAVNSPDAHQSVDGEATAVFPLRHRPHDVARQRAAPPVETQEALARLRRYRRDGMGFDRGSGMNDGRDCRGGVEHAVDDHAIEVQVRIGRRAEVVEEGDRTETSRDTRTRASCGRLTRALDPLTDLGYFEVTFFKARVFRCALL
jgi:hypothetical protein